MRGTMRNRLQVPVIGVSGLSVVLTVSYDGEWTEDDARVVVDRFAEVSQRERKYLEAQGKGDVPARIPKDPCGCGGAGS
jgi:hypothetical protein